MPHSPIRPRARKPDLRAADILAWADDHHRRHGRWPYIKAGRIPGTADQTWAAVDQALRVGLRGLPGGAGHRGRPYRGTTPAGREVSDFRGR